jgi:hypothetical protein
MADKKVHACFLHLPNAKYGTVSQHVILMLHKLRVGIYNYRVAWMFFYRYLHHANRQIRTKAASPKTSMERTAPKSMVYLKISKEIAI